MNLLERMRELRSKMGYSQTEMADFLKISRQAYNNYERGVRIPDIDTIKKLAVFFNVSTDYLLGLTNSPEEQKEKMEDSYISILSSDGSRMKIPIPSDKAERLKALLKAGLPELLDDDRFKDL